MMRPRVITARISRQRGISAIEFALVFPVMILVFYAVVSYSVVFLYLLTLNSLVAESARSAVGIFTSDAPERAELVAARIQGVVDNSWMPSGTVTGCDSSDTYFEIGESNLLSVCLSAPLPMPPLRFGGLRVPDVPENLTASASIQMAEM